MSQPSYECAYCGVVKSATDDHIPPQSIYSPPGPAQAPTVKACADCNAGASDDDEYFRDTLVKWHGIGDKPEAQPLVQKMIRALGKPAKRRYAAKTFQSIGQAPVYTRGGLLVGMRPSFAIEVPTLRRAAIRYVRGLYRYERGEPIADARRVSVVIDPDRINERMRETLESFRGSKLRVVQKRVFFYKYGYDDAQPGESVWLLVFFDAFPILATVRRDAVR